MYFGRYYRNNETELEPIEWIEISSDSKGIKTLISKEIIELKAFDENGNSNSFNQSTIKQWLNDTLINIAFSPKEQKHLVMNPTTKAKINLPTIDQIKLLESQKVEEVNLYILAKQPHSYILQMKKNEIVEMTYTFWLLEGCQNWRLASRVNVLEDKSHCEYGLIVNYDRVGIRPVIQIKA